MIQLPKSLTALFAGLMLGGSAFAASASDIDSRGNQKDGATGYQRLTPPAILPTFSPNMLPDFNSSAGAQGSFDVAQSADAAFRINQLEEQVRMLNGKVEELNFQLLQMQEQIRRMQEDNEFRFQELEQKRGSVTSDDGNSVIASNQDAGPANGVSGLEKPEPSVPASGNDRDLASSGGNMTFDGVEIFDPSNPDHQDSRDTSGGNQSVLPLGTLVFDQDGNVVDTAIGKPLELGRPRTDDSREEQVAFSSADELYDLGYSYIQSGDYEMAETSFRRYADKYPDGERISEAQFWLGESLFARNRFKEAAQIYIDAHKQWPNGRLAPQTLLKLGVSLAGLNQRELACATYAEVGKKYPSASGAVKRKVVAEQQSAKCITN